MTLYEAGGHLQPGWTRARNGTEWPELIAHDRFHCGPLSRRVRARLAVRRAVDAIAIALVDCGHGDAALWLWRACRMLRERPGHRRQGAAR